MRPTAPKPTGKAPSNPAIRWPPTRARPPAKPASAELILTHITNQYHSDPQPLLDEARRFYDGPISVAHDLYQVEVS